MIYLALFYVCLFQETNPALILKEHTRWVYCVSYSPDGSTLLSTSADHHLIAWNTETGKKKSQFKHTDFIYCASFSPDGKYIAAGCRENSILIIDSKTFKLQNKIEGHEDIVSDVRYDRAGSILIAACDDRVCIFETGSYRKQKTIDTKCTSAAIAPTPDGKELFYDGYMRLGLMDISTGKSIYPYPRYKGIIFSMALSPDGRLLAIGDSTGSLAIWKTQERKELHMIDAHEGTTFALAFSSDGKTIASGGQDGLVRLWDAETGKLLLTLQGHENDVFSVAIRPNGRQVASGSKDGTVRLWDIKEIKK